MSENSNTIHSSCREIKAKYGSIFKIGIKVDTLPKPNDEGWINLDMICGKGKWFLKENTYKKNDAAVENNSDQHHW